ncbi:MAG: hypothetical protein GY938_16630 [Ketobacter sp.]|nr:hypothetical protein [Ketobacter sp.]
MGNSSINEIEGRVIVYPPSGFKENGDPVHYIVLPPKWKGEHKEILEIAIDAAAKTNSTYRQFAISVTLLENWDMPFMTGNPQNWNYAQFDLNVLEFVEQIVTADYSATKDVKKNYSNPFLSGWKVTKKPE